MSYAGFEIRTYPTVSWRNRRNNGESKAHYTGDYRRTLCGVRIPQGRESGDGEMCEHCLKIAEVRSKESV